MLEKNRVYSHDTDLVSIRNIEKNTVINLRFDFISTWRCVTQYRYGSNQNVEQFQTNTQMCYTIHIWFKSKYRVIPNQHTNALHHIDLVFNLKLRCDGQHKRTILDLEQY